MTLLHANRDDVKVVQELLPAKRADAAESGGDGAVGKASVRSPKMA